jgi:hypothetical protein
MESRAPFDDWKTQHNKAVNSLKLNKMRRILYLISTFTYNYRYSGTVVLAEIGTDMYQWN